MEYTSTKDITMLHLNVKEDIMFNFWDTLKILPLVIKTHAGICGKINI
jgi:hypothetical protein